MKPCFYMLASQKNGTIYAGSTSDIVARIEQHRSRPEGSFTARYGVIRLVHVEFYDLMVDAIQREKRVKKWKRAWKVELIESTNPDWNDLRLTMPW